MQMLKSHLLVEMRVVHCYSQNNEHKNNLFSYHVPRILFNISTCFQFNTVDYIRYIIYSIIRKYKYYNYNIQTPYI